MIASTVAGSRSPFSRSTDSIASTRSARSSSTLALRGELALEDVDVHNHARVGILAPQLARVEADGVRVLRRLAAPVRVRVGEHPGGMHAHDHAAPTADVARQPRVPGGMHVPGD